MRDYVAELLDIMDKECQIYRELELVEREKKRIIIDNDVKALEAITGREQGFVKTIVNLEGLRAKVIDGFCQFKGISKIDTVDEIMEHLSSSEKLKMEEKKKALVGVVNSIMDVSDLNFKLLEQSIEYIDYTMEIARSLGKADIGYDKEANDRVVKVDKNLFDAKI